MRESPRKSFKFLFIVLINGFIGIIVFGWMFLSVIYAPLKEDLGKRAVMDMYNFDTVTQLSDQDSDLKSITDEDGYNALSVTRSDNSLNKYLKFNKKPVSVNVINSVFNNGVFCLVLNPFVIYLVFAIKYVINKKTIIKGNNLKLLVQ